MVEPTEEIIIFSLGEKKMITNEYLKRVYDSVEEAGPEQAQGAREVDVEPLFGVARLEGAL